MLGGAASLGKSDRQGALMDEIITWHRTRYPMREPPL
jgi:hypothetical protein